MPSCSCWEGLGAGGEGADRGWDGWMTSPTPWAWAWVNSRSWWWTGRPGMLWFLELWSQTRLSNWTELNCFIISGCIQKAKSQHLEMLVSKYYKMLVCVLNCSIVSDSVWPIMKAFFFFWCFIYNFSQSIFYHFILVFCSRWELHPLDILGNKKGCLFQECTPCDAQISNPG